MPGSAFGTKQRCVSAVIAALTVFVVICPCRPDQWKLEYTAAAFAAVMGLVLYADSAKVSVVVTMAFAAIALHWKWQQTREQNIDENFTVRAPHAIVASDPDAPQEEDPALQRSAGARVSFGAGSGPTLPDPGISVEDLMQLTPPELLEAAQTNAVPRRDG